MLPRSQGCQDLQGLQWPQGPQGPPCGGTCDPNITFNTTGLETSFADLSSSMLYLLDAQQVTNQHFHQQMQLSNNAQQSHVDALKELKVSNLQRYFDYIFASIPIFY